MPHHILQHLPDEEDGAKEASATDQICRAFNAAPVAMFIMDTARRLVHCNQAGERVIGPRGTASRTEISGSLRALTARDGPATAVISVADNRELQLTSVHIGDGWLISATDRCPSQADESLHQKARFDPLTGLPNRFQFRERLAEIATHARARKQSAALLYLDLDRFKQVNDTLGHPIGDALLCKVAERMQAALRPGDVIGRLGGDEFAVLCEFDKPEGLSIIGQRLIDLISRPYLVDGHLITVGASIGAALIPHDAEEPDRLAKYADLALYRAKADGRGVMRYYLPEMTERAQARRLLEFDLRKALALRQFYLDYQPQFDTKLDQVSGFEALVRWQHPERGLLSPTDFVPLAEETGLIVAIGEWVMRTAVTEASTWPQGVTIAVNVSPVQFRSGKLPDAVEAILAETGVAPHRLELEITESVLLDDGETNRAILTRLHELGVKIVIDDFGTGYSSLAYLQTFPFDKIKIDQSFVRDMSSDSEAIVRAVVDLGASLGIRTIAEGVETQEEFDRLRAHGCNSIQGFLFGVPTTPQGAHAIMARQETP